MERGDRRDDVLELRPLQLRIDRQGQRLERRALRLRKIPATSPKVAEAFLQMQRHRVIDLGPDATLGEELAQIVAALAADHVLIEDMTAAGDRLRPRYT